MTKKVHQINDRRQWRAPKYADYPIRYAEYSHFGGKAIHMWAAVIGVTPCVCASLLEPDELALDLDEVRTADEAMEAEPMLLAVPTIDLIAGGLELDLFGWQNAVGDLRFDGPNDLREYNNTIRRWGHAPLLATYLMDCCRRDESDLRTTPTPLPADDDE